MTEGDRGNQDAPEPGQQRSEPSGRARRRRGWLKWLWLLPVLLLAAYVWWRMHQPPAVEVVHPQKRMVVQTLTASGRVEGARQADLSLQRAGVLVEVLVDEGDRVEAGDVVARISSEVEQAELERAEAAVDTAEAELARARAQARTLPPTIEQTEAEVSGNVEQAREQLAAAEARLAELLAGGREEERRQAEAAVDAAEAEVRQAELDLQRARRLAESDATARAALERARAAAATAQSRVLELEARLAQSRRDLQRFRRLLEEGVIAEQQYEEAATTVETQVEALDQARSQLEQARVEVDRQEKLLEVTRQEAVDRAETGLRTARQRLEQARAQLELVTSPAREEQINQQRAQLRQFRAALATAQQAGSARVRSVRLTPAQEAVLVAQRRLQEAREAVDTARAQVRMTEVRAEFAGVVTDVARRPGDAVSPGQPVVTISEMDLPEVRVEIDERDIAEVQVGQDAFLIADAYPDQRLPAVVDRIAPEALTERGIIDVILRPLERPTWLRTGMTVDASIVVAPRQEFIVLPAGAVVQSGQQYYVLTVEGGEVRRIAVTTGVGGVRGTIIESGLSTDAMVVRQPATVRVGQKVRPVEVEPNLGDGNAL